MAELTFLPRDWDDFVTQALADWQVPGLSLSIVKDDIAVLTRGYGVRRLGADEPVDGETVFAIASASKPFASAAAAALVDAGKLRWDDPIIAHVPDFRLRDPWLTAHVTVRDILCHRTGLPDGTDMLLKSGCDLGTAIRRLRYLEPAHDFRTQFAYNNTVFSVIGEVVAAAAGMSWSQVIQERIFEALHMASSSTNLNGLAGLANVASPHKPLAAGVTPIPRRDIGNDPAGSINSNAVDMAQWLRMLLAKGRYADIQVLSPEAVREVHSPHMAIPHPEDSESTVYLYAFQPDVHFWAVGLGWIVMDYRGKRLIWHPGAIDGFVSLTALLPDESFGFNILVNSNPTFIHGMLMFTLLDAYLGVQERNWAAESLQLVQQFMAQGAAQAQRVAAARAADTTPSLPLAAYAGSYRDAWAGEARITAEDGSLRLAYGARNGAALEHWHYDTFRLAWDDVVQSSDFATFGLDKMGRVETLTVETLGVFHRAG
jgi:CubicO group peptidase (beta-lactamase class C family)